MSFEKSSLESVKSSASLVTPSPVDPLSDGVGGFLVELGGFCAPIFNGFPHALFGVGGDVDGCWGFPQALETVGTGVGRVLVLDFTVGRAGNSSFVVRLVLVGGTVDVDCFCWGLGGLVGGIGDSERAGNLGVVDDVDWVVAIDLTLAVVVVGADVVDSDLSFDLKIPVNPLKNPFFFVVVSGCAVVDVEVVLVTGGSGFISPPP